jgi:hypothetical protein
VTPPGIFVDLLDTSAAKPLEFWFRYGAAEAAPFQGFVAAVDEEEECGEADEE